MSDPVTNVEIEDVLSSIRRLVSVDSTRNRRAPDPAPAQPPAAQKLVLTEDYRVTPEPVAPELSEQSRVADLASDYTRTLERRIAELEAAVNAQASEFEPDGSEDASQHRPTSMLFATPKPASAQEPDGAVTLETLLADDDTNDRTEIMNADADQSAVDVAETKGEPTEMWSDDDPLLSCPVPEGEGIEVLEAESHQKTRRANDTDDFNFSADDAVIDEDTLRDMVAEIVREELQGALGERITRNVRKLVRREIMRAISIRDFE